MGMGIGLDNDENRPIHIGNEKKFCGGGEGFFERCRLSVPLVRLGFLERV